MAAKGPLSHRIELEGPNDEFRELADAFDAMLARLETAAAARSASASAPSTPGRSTSPRHCCCSAAPASGPSPEATSTCPSSPKKPLKRSSPRGEARRHHRGLRGHPPAVGSHALLLQLTTNLLHNAIVHNLPEHGAVQVKTAIGPGSVMLIVENTGENLSPQLVSTLTEPFQRGTERIRGDHAGAGLGLAVVKSITQASLNLNAAQAPGQGRLAPGQGQAECGASHRVAGTGHAASSWPVLTQRLGHPVIVDGHAAEDLVLALQHREALPLEEAPGQLASLREQPG
jgi:two-component system, OmpR family, sensor histidine kinase VanS